VDDEKSDAYVCQGEEKVQRGTGAFWGTLCWELFVHSNQPHIAQVS